MALRSRRGYDLDIAVSGEKPCDGRDREDTLARVLPQQVWHSLRWGLL
jgi:hypothetical protein